MKYIRCRGCDGVLAQVTEMGSYDGYELTTRDVRIKNGKVYLFCEVCCSETKLDKANVRER